MRIKIDGKATGRSLVLGALLTVLLTASSVTSLAAQQPNADDAKASDYLQRIHRAAHKLNYRGIFIYHRDAHIESMRVVHRVRGDEVRERLYSLNGSAREIIRDSDNVWCYIPEQNARFKHYRQLARGNFPRLPLPDIAHITKLYELSVAGAERVAGHQAQIISLRAPDSYRYGYLLWPHVQSGLLLRMDILDATQRSMETYMFASVDINVDIADEELLPETPQKDLVQVEAGSAADPSTSTTSGDVISPWRIVNKPLGFKLRHSIHRPSPVNMAMMDHLVLSDGLAVVSIFIEPLQHTAKHVRGMNHMGPLHAYGRVVDGRQVTVIGEVPATTVRMMGDSLVRAD